jgi:hypothetical protein
MFILHLWYTVCMRLEKCEKNAYNIFIGNLPLIISHKFLGKRILVEMKRYIRCGLILQYAQVTFKFVL